MSIALIVISACELMALFYAYQNRYVKWESMWVIFVEVAPPPPPASPHSPRRCERCVLCRSSSTTPPKWSCPTASS